MNRKMLFIFNPLSGKGGVKNNLLNIVDTFVKDGWDVLVRPTQSFDDAYDYIRNNGEHFEQIVISGGDGTLNQGIRGIMSFSEDKRPKVGYIPAGTTNDFASNMKIPKNMKKAALNIVNGIEFKCDIGEFNEKNFIYVAAFGAFTDVAYDTPQQTKNIIGHLAYVFEGAKKLPNIRPYYMKIIHDETEIEGEFIFGMVSNTNYLGGIKAEKAFQAQMNDGLFEVILVKNPKNVIERQELLSRLVTQEFSTDSFISFRTSNVCFSSKEAVPWTLDGEYGGSVENADIIIKKQALSLMVEKEPDFKAKGRVG